MRYLLAMLCILSALGANAASQPPPNEALSSRLQALLDAAPAQAVDGELRALLVPASTSLEGSTSAATAYRAVMGQHYQRVLLIGSDPQPRSRRIELLEGDQLTPLGRVSYDQNAAEILRSYPLVHIRRPNRHQQYPLLRQLPMLQQSLAEGWQLLALQIGRIEGRDFTAASEMLEWLISPETLVVVVGDFTQYGPRFGYTPFPPDANLEQNLGDIDRGAFGYIQQLDPDGLADYLARIGQHSPLFTPLRLLLNLLPSTTQVVRSDYRIESLPHQHRSSYTSALFSAAPSEAISPTLVGEGPYAYADMQMVHELASRAVEASTMSGRRPPLGVESLGHGMPEALQKPAELFITLYRHGRVRGRNHAELSDQPLYLGVLESARAAALHDHDFYPLEASELDKLDISIDLVTDSQPLEEPSNYPEGAGISMQCFGRRGELLPREVAEQGLDHQRSLERLAEEMGLRRNDWLRCEAFSSFTTQSIQAPYLPR